MEEIIGSLFPLVGACALIYGLIVPRWQVAQTTSWPSVTGVVIGSKISNSGDSNFTSGTTNTYYTPTIKYKHQVGTRKFINNRIHAGGSFYSSIPSKANELVARYHEGAEVDVYYNPDNPSKSCLEKTEETSLLYMGIGALFIVVGFMFN
ncbi:MAG: hypothetical protein ACI9XC_002415 [Gammaproteobacteria bacterium]|jgi:hypothetical protein